MRKKQKGSLTIEAAMGIPIFLAIVFGWVEICIMTFSMSMTDNALTTAVMRVKKAGDSSNSNTVNYSQMIQQELAKAGGSLWSNVVEPGSVKIKVHYFRNYDSFLKCTDQFSSADECPERKDDPVDMAIAVYDLKYNYDPIVSIWFPTMAIRREVVTIQEYERCAFKIGQGAGCAS
ncbi:MULTISPECIES: TadE/TadG family type IV pilus assembly protein [unclassified Vibrio]|uniref:TadE/TadG family type IV pilus assembly protein n=1 Tax=unclassified Vibrio TaxID=2614977 RepID=UPI00136189C4|nr:MULTISPECIES: TadE family protein [unclassified Vibrio]NAW56494.1 pilus assembly protein [Vibrio sp. V36_P2S2PM302]NAX25781.1 pilus assembly protein [Vibrio sp. V38_P2S17PM301]NAX32304.1 pilus assembly protein [Vibrio sp. V37_P2S8PM304]